MKATKKFFPVYFAVHGGSIFFLQELNPKAEEKKKKSSEAN